MSKINQNIDPYFNDFDPSKNYVQELFVPARPVQARELTQLQSILQDQIGSFADSIFKNGSKVSNCRTALVTRDYVRVADMTPVTNVLTDIKSFNSTYTIVGTVSGIHARLIQAVNATGTAGTSTNGDPATMFVVYTSTGIDGLTTKFIPGEILSIYDANSVLVYQVTVRCPGCAGDTLPPEISATGKSTFFVIDAGIMYYNQNFVHVNAQEIITEKYTPFNSDGFNISTNSYKVGLDVSYAIIDYNQDSTLLDPSLGYPNNTAPGADRLQVMMSLSRRTISSVDGDNFILLARIGVNGTIQYMVSGSDYSGILDLLAQRTYDASGNFTVTPFKTKFYNSLKKSASDPYGWSLSGSDSKLVAVVSPGSGYVKGYNVITTTDTVVSFDKARDTDVSTSYTTYFSPRSSVIVTPVKTTVWLNNNSGSSVMGMKQVLLYTGPVVSNATSGSVIGSMYIYDEFRNGTTYELFFYNLQMNAGTNISQVQSIGTADGVFVASPVLSSGIFGINNADNTSLLWKTGVQNIKTMRSAANNSNGNTIMEVRRKLTGTLDSSGTITFTASTNESFVGYNPTLNIGWIGTYPATSQITFTSGNLTISDTSLVINLGSSFAGQLISLTADVIRTQQKEITKTLTSYTYTTSAAPSGVVGETFNLGYQDGYKLLSVTMVNPSDGSYVPVDVTKEFVFSGGQTDSYYGDASITRVLGNGSIISNNRLIISFQYFAHSGTGYFTVDSYSQLITDTSLGLSYADIPKYTATNGVVYNLSESIDFRPIYTGGIVDPNALIPKMSSTVIYDVEYYLSRTDLLQIDENNNIYVKKGNPSLNPTPPTPDANAMSLYQINLKPYTYTINDVNTTFINNRVYTMKNIGDLETRISNIEYYTALSLLEQSASNLNITDSTGLSVFKNGFVVDNFSDYEAADLTNVEFKSSLDRPNGQLRPQFYSTNRRLIKNTTNSSNIQWFGSVGMMPFTEYNFSSNPYATDAITVNPYIEATRIGSMVLSPNIDTWCDASQLPLITANMTSGTSNLKNITDINEAYGTDWGTWVDMNQTIVKDGHSGQIISLPKVTTASSVITTSNTTSTVSARRNSYNVGDVVSDVQIQPFVRSQIIEFYVSKMRPNTIVYAYFDGIAVSDHCRMITQVPGDNVLVAQQQTVFGGAPLVTDSLGNINGQFSIPVGMFFTGEKLFILSDDSNLAGNPDAETTRASSSFFAGGIQQSVQSQTLNVMSSTFSSQQLSQTTSTASSVSRASTVTASPSAPYVAGTPNSQQIPQARWTDPIAQSFTITNACFITAIDLYFQNVDSVNDLITVDIRQMNGGFPSNTILGKKTYTPGQLNALGGSSNDSTKVIKVVFDVPIYLDSNTTYAFAVSGYSPNTRIWVSTVGNTVVNMNGKIAEQPPQQYTSFRSINGSSWNTEPLQTIKFNLYQAIFDISAPMVINFQNDQTDGQTFVLDNNPIETQAGQNQVRIYAKNHGLTTNDRVSISMYDGLPFTITVSSSYAPPQVGQIMTTSSGSGTVANITATSTSGTYLVYLSKVTGILNNGEQYTCASQTINLKNNYLLTQNGGSIASGLLMSESVGYIASDIKTSFTFPSVGGVGFEYFSKEHIVVDVDSIDTFIIQVSQSFTLSSRYGGSNVTAWQMNFKYDVFNVAGGYIPYGATENWTAQLIGHGDASNSLLSAFDYTLKPIISIAPLQDVHMSYPAKLASNNNEVRVLGSTGRSVNITGTLSSTNNLLSPVINQDSWSITTISNRVGSQTLAAMNVAPNATGRFIGETSSSGVESYKYVTQNIMLAKPAHDIQVYVNVYKDITADYDIYFKPITPYETRSNSQVPWILADNLTKTQSSSNLDDFIEINALASEVCSTWPATDFISFRVKIVGKANTSGLPPIFEKFRAIAIT